jgi:hypothetical protein
MDAYEPLRRRGYFLSDSGQDSGAPENESAEGIAYNRALRPRRSRKVPVGSARSAASPRHRATSSQDSRTSTRSSKPVTAAIATGTRRP